MKFSIRTLALLTGLATAAPTERDASPLAVQLAPVGPTKVKAAITNNGEKGYNLFHKGSFLDSQPVDKVTLTNGNAPVNFTGVLLSMARSGLTEASFFTLEAGETREVEFDIAELYDMSETATYDMVAEGAFPYAEMGSTELVADAIAFSSNTLSMNINGEQAATIHANYAAQLQKRTVIQSDCSSSRRSALVSAYSGCQSLASRAASDAASGSSTQYRRYFASSSASTVAARLRAVANECSSTSGGVTRSYCNDILGACEPGVIAYTQPANNVIAHCDIYYSQLTANPNSCDGLTRDRAATTLHEVTHARGVYSPNTVDYAYGTSASTQLSPSQALLNADSYALYAADLALGC